MENGKNPVSSGLNFKGDLRPCVFFYFTLVFSLGSIGTPAETPRQ